MITNRARLGTPKRRGALLLEVLLSIALFAGASAFALGAARSVFDALDRGKRQQQAVDIARSKMAELEAGLITIRDLRSEWSGEIGSYESDLDFDAPRNGLDWTIEVQTFPSEFGGLNLVELTVTELTDQTSDGGGFVPMSITLRQLMPPREAEVEAYQEDELIEGLPEGEP
ncbi:MAG: hypothetical protein V3T53_14715 [Phycisphaerales bacterium]